MNNIVRRWLRASLQGTIALGTVMIVLVWGTIWLHLDSLRQNAIQDAFQDTSNLARSFERHIASTIRGEDGTLLVLRAMYQRNPDSFEFIDWSKHDGLISDMVLQYSVIDRNGILVASSLGPVSPMDLGDREHFKVHLGNPADELFISKLLVGRNSARQSIQLSRKLTTMDGEFAGVIVASLDPAKLIKFYETIDLGKDGAIVMRGTDGFIRAAVGIKRDPSTLMSSPSGTLARMKDASEGQYVSDGSLDGIVRIITYRKVESLPLVAIVGFSKETVLASYQRYQLAYLSTGMIVTGFVFLVMGLSLAHRRKLERAYLALRRSEALMREHKSQLRTTLENIDQGIIMVDAHGLIQVINRRTIELLDLSDEWLVTGRSLKDMLTYLWQRDEFVNNEFAPHVLEMLTGNGLDVYVDVYERVRPNGVVLEIRSLKTPEGGLVRTFTDVTERKRAEARIAEMARQDDLTGLANRVLFRERIEQSFKRAHRFKEGFALLMLDLDRFKPINDSLGHQVGDRILEQVAERLEKCVRETDTVARIGGDEFAILQANVTDEAEAAQLAERILAAIAKPFTAEGREIEVGVSIGIAFSRRDAADYDRLLAKADNALYDAKKSGRNRYAFVSRTTRRKPRTSEHPLAAAS